MASLASCRPGIMPSPRQLYTLLMSFPPFALPSLDSMAATVLLSHCTNVKESPSPYSSLPNLLLCTFVFKLGLVYGGGFCLVCFNAAAVCFALFGGHFIKSKLVWNSQSY